MIYREGVSILHAREAIPIGVTTVNNHCKGPRDYVDLSNKGLTFDTYPAAFPGKQYMLNMLTFRINV